ncbi:phosphate-starvation-inducible PsiE family protein [Methanoregula sp.]|uniref:phosphate-starvation-inducible PsiE family protein n=1 Tax=Methanoregula sp. TaxID=2052170 RepID=UPI00236DF308|nr:phosphate-starvation-inducible PsiE family protein [Methanoregula sp.]MDD1686060.1 phosphate-starvation-inducible PsiE family protein [Methanoregula sp.]
MKFLDSIDKIEKGIYAALIIMLIIVLLAAVVDLVIGLYNVLVKVTPIQAEAHEMITLLGGFLLVLIGVELLETIKAYFHENTIHVEIVVLLAIIAVSRKVIIMDPTSMSGFEFGFELMSIGVIIVGLGAGYYLIKKAGITIGPGGMRKPEE